MTYDVAATRTGIINANLLLGRTATFTNIINVLGELATAGQTFVKYNGAIIAFLTADGWQTKQFTGDVTAQWNVEDNWKDFGSGGIGGIYNVTVEAPLTGAYYVLCDTQHTSISAVHVALAQHKAQLGMILSFEISRGHWKTYQYTGLTLDASSWTDASNWKDFGSLAAGSEAYVIVNNIDGITLPANGHFTLESALGAVIAYKTSTGIDYAKPGLVMSYLVADNKMETKQFTGTSKLDFGEVTLWKDFGGAGLTTANDSPTENGKDAFSTGGAYAQLIST
jgi:hypothetical protein